MTQRRLQPYTIEPWRPTHDSTAFSSGISSIDRYIQNQAQRDMTNLVSMVFVLTEPGDLVVRGYFALSSLGIVFSDLPPGVQKKLPRYPQISATLLGRLGVDRNYSAELLQRHRQKPRLDELLFVNAQIKTVQGAISTQGSALLVIDAEETTAEEKANGIRDPLGFYIQYGFVQFPGNQRRVFKTTRIIESELRAANLI